MLTEIKRALAVNRADATPRILIVEESEINRRLAQHVFIQAGYLTETVTNGHDAVRAVKQRRYDLIVMDCRLSDFPQFMATRMIRLHEDRVRSGRRIPIVGLTAFAPPGFQERCLRAGMDACFEKPFRDEIMQQILVRWLTDAGHPRTRLARQEPLAVLSADRPPLRGASPPGQSGTCQA